jgi:3-hydroxy-9,10-secoandrosta-1,3,5(10)-triene-9,17-dione monooxygenase reductase component
VTAGVDSAQFRQLLGRFATGVVVLTAVRKDGQPVGMTANSVASVSLEPPLVLVCIDHAATMYPTITTTERFVVNVLAAHQEAISRRFAGQYDDRFDGIGYRVSPPDLVLLDEALAHIECERFARHEAGDHTIVIGRVVGGAAHNGRPLLYYRGGYAVLG